MPLQELVEHDAVHEAPEADPEQDARKNRAVASDSPAQDLAGPFHDHTVAAHAGAFLRRLTYQWHEQRRQQMRSTRSPSPGGDRFWMPLPARSVP